MSLEIEDQWSLDQPLKTDHDPQKKCKISYSRDFLLSLGELDVCKKLPSGFDQSFLSEFNDASHNVQDRQRISGSFSLQSFKRNEYGSSPPAREDLSNFSRGIHGRWDNRSIGRSDRDSDPQSDWDSDSGRRYGNQSRRSWQTSEHDGLLGSGSFPRPSGYSAGSSAPKVRANDHYQLNRSSEPYHPPRPYKAVPPSRRDTDLFNDETFGSSECTSQDRAEEERRRRASFELMRKEQHKAWQDKQKSNLDQPEKKSVSDITALFEDSKDQKKLVSADNVLDESEIQLAPINISGKSSFVSQAPAPRPLVPPGFTSTVLERNFETKPSIHPIPEEPAQKMGFRGLQFESMNIHIPLVDKGEKIVNSSSASEASSELIRMNNQSHEISNILEACEALEDDDILKLEVEKEKGTQFIGEPDHNQSSSILDKLFGTAITVNNGCSPSFIEHHDIKADDMWSPNTSQSSKFAHWFLEEEKKPVDDYSSGRSSDLLSLIVGGEKGLSEVSDVKSTEQIISDFPLKSSEPTNEDVTSNLSSATVGISAQLHNINKPEAIPAVLTCEDLEQSILSEIGKNSSPLHPSVQGSRVLDVKTEQPNADIDDHASQQLLSLLQKGTRMQKMPPFSNVYMVSSDKLHFLEAGNIETAPNNAKEENAEKVRSPSKTLTLETLFGTAFMKELQGSVGSARIDVSEPHGLSSSMVDDGLFPPIVDGIGGLNKTSHESSLLMSSNRQETNLGIIEGDWYSNLGFNDHQHEMGSMNLGTEVGSKLGGFDAGADIRLPEEESLIVISDPVNPTCSSFISPVNATKAQLLSSPNMPVEIAEKLAALNVVLKDERHMVRGQEGPPFQRGPYNLMESEIPRQNVYPQSSSPQFNHPQINHGRPLFHPFDSHHINPQLKFTSPESIINHDAPPHQLPANMLRPHFQHPNTGLSGFDPSGHHAMLQQMHMPGNFPPPHLLNGFPRGAPLPPQPSNHAASFVQDANPMQGFPFGHRNPNFGTLGMPLPAHDGGGASNNPDALQRLLEMELRSNPKQVNPFAIAGHNQGYGHELDTGFRYNR
ncbi:uncharacterized protein LOC131165954 isoform X2 [Malania oleifera]|uniref:uncharacterized protein LOC131165954 isoform X2 n=1 Tax=Malania oleifera TaxID=397392 RepID=UPI0025ADBFD4|nr:uncharacterized protein LOC131165954 isoform X2 [Malania oleifera]